MTTFTKTKYAGIDSFWLKVIAIIGMTLDHIAKIFPDQLPFAVNCLFNLFGGITFPIMAFMITEGYRHTHDVKKYMLRLLGFALLTQLPYMWAFGTNRPNVLFTLLAGLAAIYLTEHLENKWLKIVAAIILIAVTMEADWGMIGPAMVLLYHYGKRPWLNLILPILLSALVGSIYLHSLLSGLILTLPPVLFYFGGGLLSILLLHQYNGQKGRSMKYFFYIYYPLHLLVLRAIFGLMTGDWGKLF